jgi:hypothetical protein
VHKRLTEARLQVLNRPRAQSGALGQVGLSEARFDARLPQQIAKPRVCVRCRCL